LPCKFSSARQMLKHLAGMKSTLKGAGLGIAYNFTAYEAGWECISYRLGNSCIMTFAEGSCP